MELEFKWLFRVTISAVLALMILLAALHQYSIDVQATWWSQTAIELVVGLILSIVFIDGVILYSISRRSHDRAKWHLNQARDVVQDSLDEIETLLEGAFVSDDWLDLLELIYNRADSSAIRFEFDFVFENAALASGAKDLQTNVSRLLDCGQPLVRFIDTNLMDWYIRTRDRPEELSDLAGKDGWTRAGASIVDRSMNSEVVRNILKIRRAWVDVAAELHEARRRPPPWLPDSLGGRYRTRAAD